MFDKFSARAQKVMSLARQEAQRTNSEFIGGEHILLAIIEDGGGVGAKVLKNLNVDLKRIRQEIEKQITPSTSPTATLGKLPFSPRAKRVIELAGEASSQLGHHVIGTEHLLLGILEENEGIAAQVLTNLGLKLEEVRDMVLKVLRTPADRIEATPKTVSVRLWLFRPLESATANMTIVVENARYELSQIIPIQEVAPEQVAQIAQGLGSKVYLVELVK